LPERNIGAGETLDDIQYVDLHEGWAVGIERIVSVIRPDSQSTEPPPTVEARALAELRARSPDEQIRWVDWAWDYGGPWEQRLAYELRGGVPDPKWSEGADEDRTNADPNRSNDTIPGAALDALLQSLQRFAMEGRRLRDTARISDDGSSAVVEIWERDVQRALERSERHDLLERFNHADRPDPAKLLSSAWATRRRLGRELAEVAVFINELAAIDT
jgi:hypothetical protein